MSSFPTEDYEVALKLYQELNGFAFESVVGSLDMFSPVGAYFGMQSQRQQPTTIDLNTTDESPAATTSTSRVTFENQQAITIQKDRKCQSDYYMPIINTFIDLRNNQEWSEVNTAVNLPKITDCIIQHYFKTLLSDFKSKISWDVNNVISDGSSFKIFQSENEILISMDLQVKPRLQLISTIFHILIHLYLSSASKDEIRINHHDDNFREIMIFLNSKLNLKVTTSHKVDRCGDDFDFPNQWYHCSGICGNYEPFHGVIRCTTVPCQMHSFWSSHEQVCGGQFFKLFEIYRTNQETQDVEKKYLKNVRYMFPKPREGTKRRRDHLKSRIPAREFCDLTGDDDDINEGEAVRDVKVENLCEVINLDESCYLDIDPATSRSSNNYASKFIKKHDENISLEVCPFCKLGIGISKLCEHFDKCRGHQEKVFVNLKKM